jgi:4-amino-4-deoxy-L-arabinose transferase-like glycosyltransferase
LLVVYYFTSKVYGRLAGISAILSLAFLPTFFGLAHLDMKDVPFAALYGLTIILFWKGVTNKSWKWVTVSSLVFGLMLASRIQAFTVLFVIYGWLLLTQLHKIHLKSNLTASLITFPIIGGIVFLLSWPWLWLDPANNLLAVFKYFQDRNFAVLYFGQVLYTQINLPWHYAIVMLAITTPILILILFIIGGISALKRSWSLREEASVLVLLWFGVSIIRSSMPSIFPVYNSTRLFTEIYLPLCILAGLGASWSYTFIHSHSIKYLNSQHLLKTFSAILIIGLIAVPSFIAMYQLHPYEYSYYNELVGGVNGAYGQFDIDYWFQAYAQGAIWLNEHAIRNATILIPTSSSWSTFYFTRSDLKIMFSPNYSQIVAFCLQNLKPAYTISIEGAPVLYIYNTTNNKDPYPLYVVYTVVIGGYTYSTTSFTSITTSSTTSTTTTTTTSFTSTTTETTTNSKTITIVSPSTTTYSTTIVSPSTTTYSTTIVSPSTTTETTTIVSPSTTIYATETTTNSKTITIVSPSTTTYSTTIVSPSTTTKTTLTTLTATTTSTSTTTIVIPEFPSTIMLATLMTVSAALIIFIRKKFNRLFPT